MYFDVILMLFMPINALRCDQTWQCTALVLGILSKSGSEVSAWLQGGTVLREKPTVTFRSTMVNNDPKCGTFVTQSDPK